MSDRAGAAEFDHSTVAGVALEIGRGCSQVGHVDHLLGADRRGQRALRMRRKDPVAPCGGKFGAARCIARPAASSPFSVKCIDPNSAPQTRVAFSSIVSNTGCQIARRRADDLKHVRGRGLLLQRLR